MCIRRRCYPSIAGGHKSAYYRNRIIVVGASRVLPLIHVENCMIELTLLGIITLAMFVQGAAGFGSALIAMPIIIQLLGLKVAAPTFALVAQTAGIIVLIRYRQNIDPRRV